MRHKALASGLAVAVLMSATAAADSGSGGLPPTYGVSMTSDRYADEIGYSGESTFVVLVENTGSMTDVVTVDINQDALPPGVSQWEWYAVYCTPDGTCYFGPEDFELSAGEVETLTVHMTDYLGAVRGRAVTSLTAKSNGDTTVQLRETYGTFVEMPSVLLVDDDAGASHQAYLETALIDTGYPPMPWDAHGRGRPSSLLLESFWAVLWTTADGDCSYLTADDEARMAAYLDAGGNLFLSSTGFLSSRGAPSSFVTDHLRIGSWNTDDGESPVAGVVGDPISGGMVLDLSGGPLPYTDSDSFDTDGGVVTFEATASAWGVRIEGGGRRAVFNSFPFENVPLSAAAPDNQKALARRIIEWFEAPAGVGDDPELAAGEARLKQKSPNPFNPSNTIRFAVPDGGARVTVDVYSIGGRRVRSLLSRELAPGPHAVTWDGRDDEGREVASGLYFARYSADGQTSERKMTLLR